MYNLLESVLSANAEKESSLYFLVQRKETSCKTLQSLKMIIDNQTPHAPESIISELWARRG